MASRKRSAASRTSTGPSLTEGPVVLTDYQLVASNRATD